MNEFIVFLRGINVGGHRKIPMAELKAELNSKGFEFVKTYIQSGNIYLHSKLESKEVETLIEQIIANHFEFDVPTFVVSKNRLAEILSEIPFLESEGEIYFTLYKGEISNENIHKLKSIHAIQDEIKITKNCIYLLCKNGYGNTKLSNPFLEKSFKIVATTRNRKTMETMVLMS